MMIIKALGVVYGDIGTSPLYTWLATSLSQKGEGGTVVLVQILTPNYVSNHFLWKLYAMIKDMSPSFVSFYNFPHEKLIGVSRHAEI